MTKLLSHGYNLIIFFIISSLMSITGKLRPWNPSNPYEILSLNISSKLSTNSDAIKASSKDFGKIVQEIFPAAVLYPSCVNDIIDLIQLSYGLSVPFHVAARGHGHSIRGQAMAQNGVVVEMNSLTTNNNNLNNGIRVSRDSSLGFYADVGGEQLWIDVLHATLEHGLAPVSWTDYLYLTVGGTLSNAGISGQTFRHGPQISNIHEMDVITGKGEFVTCSKHRNSELFFAVLGGLGQFGIITRARIVLDKAPTRVKWVRMLYADFSKFTKDQEHLISIDGLDYVEGSIMMERSSVNNWRSSFFSPSNQTKISLLLSQNGIIYCLEMVKYYDDHTAKTIDEELKKLVKGLNYLPGFMFKKDATYVDFLNRVRSGELELQSKGMWDVPHPWLNLFVPKSSIMDFNAAVFVDIIRRQNRPTGPILVYPTSRKKWDERMSAVIPEEETFYCVGLLHSSSGYAECKILDDQNDEILNFCDKAGLNIKQYLPHYKTEEDWIKHFGKKWNTFQQRKNQFDPKMILSPGQRIFN
ncbi:cytokinin dehydrogenase 3-like isoform X1 [Lycium barbarum]|uniref:cytokinin dehydrogenase 3-like isoform X1 n=1 Tax=Lycium barbarum TaxID=112863 RepID=UPI00293E9E67|nr:cytokinin dehydrogenase 3-like isoform X1 [Lycium barbarum]